MDVCDEHAWIVSVVVSSWLPSRLIFSAVFASPDTTVQLHQNDEVLPKVQTAPLPDMPTSQRSCQGTLSRLEEPDALEIQFQVQVRPTT